MDAADKRMLEREALRNMIQQWNANRLDLFELSEPNENLEFHGVMRFYFQDSGQKIATKCIRVASDATVSDVIETLIEKFRPDMRMLSLGSYSLWETHGPDDERRLEPHEKPLLVQLNWHADDREGRFLLKCTTTLEGGTLTPINEKSDQNFKRKLSKREKKELKKKEKLSRLKSDTNNENRPVAEKLYTELPETSFTRSISNPEAVMRRRRQQKLERKLQQFRSKDGGPDTGGTLKIYGSSLCADVPYKTLLLSVRDSAAAVVREVLDKYGLSRHDPHHYCIVQVNMADNAEYVLEDDECPLAIVMTHPHRGSIMFHVRRRPADSQPRRRKKKVGGPGGAGGAGSGGARHGAEPALLEVAPDGSPLENARRIRLTDVLEVGSGNGMALQLYGPSIQPRHCVVASADGGGGGGGGGGGYLVTPLHADAHTYLNGQRVVHAARLQHGSLLKFGRMATFRFVDPVQENMLNRNLSQSQHFGSGSIYDRSVSSAAEGALDVPPDGDYHQRTASPSSHHSPHSPHSHHSHHHDPDNNNTLKLDDASLVLSHHLDEEERQLDDANRISASHYKDNYETTFDLDGNVETKSICSAKSGGSGHDSRVPGGTGGTRTGGGAGSGVGQEAILPAVLEFPEAGQAQFLAAVVSRLDPHAPAFKLAPVYTLYLCARYRASTHYRPELTPTERAHKLTAFLHHVATLIHTTVQERCADSAAQAFWMANASELLHFLKCDRHISSFSTQAQDLLPTTVQNAFSNLVSCFQEELAPALGELTRPEVTEAVEAVAPSLQALAAAMVLLRRCRVNAALTIQLFSHLFHYINAVCFNKLVSGSSAVSAAWGAALAARLALLGAWAERQGLELAADCHLARVHQAARLIQGTYRTAEEMRAALAACFKLNSAQVRALLTPLAPPDLVEAAVAHARTLADELYRADGREITVEESTWLGVGLLIPGDGFSAEVVRGVPPGLAEFVAPLQRGGLCRLAHQPHALGLWTVYMAGYGAAPDVRARDRPAVHIVQLHKNANGMGLSIVAAKGAGQSKLGIYIKSVVAGGAAAADGRLAAGDQLLSVDGHSLVGITQEKAAEYLVRTGPTVTLEVAKQGAVLHGLATLLHQPAYNQRQEEEVMYEHRGRRNSGTYTNTHPALLRPLSPRLELATAGIPGCRPCQNMRDEYTNSESSSDSEESQPLYHGSIPRLIITLDHENNHVCDDHSLDTVGSPLELKCSSAPPRPIPVFTFTCEDYDDCYSDTCPGNQNLINEHQPQVPVPSSYDQSSESGDNICLPPQMHPIDTKLTLDLFNACNKQNEYYRGRCTAVDECCSACDCCRSPQPETSQIPYIDGPNSEPIIYESDATDSRVATPKVRRILPSLSLDKSEDSKKVTVDAMCQTPSYTLRDKHSNEVDFSITSKPTYKKNDLKLDIKNESKHIEGMQSRIKRTLFSMSRSISSKSDDIEMPTCSTSESFEESNSSTNVVTNNVSNTSKGTGAKQILDSIDRKSWKSPDEFRPAFGTVKALTKHFNNINLRYCVKSYKRNCQSSPNLNIQDEKCMNLKENLQSSASLANILYESNKTDTTDTTDIAKLSDEEVKSILIQLEDWSKYGSRGSEDTLAQGNEFELPNLPPEETLDNNASNAIVFNEIVDKKPKTITLDNIKIKSNPLGVHIDINQVNGHKVVLTRRSSLEKLTTPKVPRSVAVIPRKLATSLVNISSFVEKSGACDSDVGGMAALRGVMRRSCPRLSAHVAPAAPPLTSGSTGGIRRASERDLPARLAAEPVKPSKSTPTLHHHHAHHSAAPATATPGTGGMWAAGKSRSSHNLSATTPASATSAPSAATHDAFYQNLAAVHSQTLNDRSSLRSSTGTSRPQSAHLATTATAAAADAPATHDSPLHHQMNPGSMMSVRAAKLAEMSEEVTRRQQQMKLYQQQQQQKPPQILPHQHLQQSPHNHQQMLQHQQNIMQQASHHQQNLQQGQHNPQNLLQQVSHSQQNILQTQHNQQNLLQQVQHNPQNLLQQVSHSQQNILQPQHNQQNLLQQVQSNQHNMLQHNHQLQQIAHNQHQTLQQSAHNQQAMFQQQQVAHMSHGQQLAVQQQQQQMHQQHQQQQLQQQHQQQPMQSPPSQQIYHNQHMQQQQRYEWHQPGPPSPQRTQPPVAPKPQGGRRAETEGDEQHNIQPDDEWYVASASEPPAVSVYPAGAAPGGGSPRGAPHNPWQREEREREAEVRRGAARTRRDATIGSLLSLGNARTPHQSQQLRALQLERDFERRATQHDQEEGASGDAGTPGAGEFVESEEEAPPAAAPAHPPAHPPKSILKSNARPAHDLSNGYAPDVTPMMLPEECRMSGVTSAMGGVSVSEPVAPPPPPPERGSSFAVMAVRARALSPHAAPASPLSPLPAAPLLPVGGPPRDKRVSFHERPPAPPATDPPPLHCEEEEEDAPPDTPPPHHDPDRFLEEAQCMLSPATPASAHTPGVIGAQEVYRDPRVRRLAEQAQAQARSAPVPEQLSFKEKMKMFALESGENSTPKDKVTHAHAHTADHSAPEDKVKISRAQRDIDAVH